MAETVLVTGCAGYIGSFLCPTLIGYGYHVIGIDNLLYCSGQALATTLLHPAFKFHKLDVYAQPRLVAELYRKADIIIPLAALVGEPICRQSPDAAGKINQVAIEEMLRELSPRQRVIFPNTNSGYGATDGTSECAEDDPMNPLSVYGVTKCAAEGAVREHENSVVLRLATVFGVSPRMRFDLLVNTFTERLVNAGSLTLYEPHFLRNYVGIRDAAMAFLFMAKEPKWRGVYNLGLPAANLTKLELAHLVCDEVGVSRGSVTIGDGKDADQRNYRVSNKKILATGFTFKHSLERGIQQVAEYTRLLTPQQIAEGRNA